MDGTSTIAWQAMDRVAEPARSAIMAGVHRSTSWTVEFPSSSNHPSPAIATTFATDTPNLVADIVQLHDRTASERAARLEHDFLARVTHELLTPLTVIRGAPPVRAGRHRC